MNEDLIGLAVTFSVVAVVLPLALLHGTHKAQEVQEAWRKLAARHRLHFEPGRRVVHKTTVAGALAGRPFLLQKAGGNNNAAFHMELGLNGSLPVGLSMKPTGGHLAAHLAVLGVPVSQVAKRTGKVTINDEISVAATDPDDIPAYLSAERKRAALRLADIEGELDDHKLRVTVTKQADDLEELDKALRTLVAVAPMLDTA
jgi:hypothetical protein